MGGSKRSNDLAGCLDLTSYFPMKAMIFISQPSGRLAYLVELSMWMELALIRYPSSEA